MKNLSFNFFNVIGVFVIIIFIVFAFCPFKLIDMKQAQRIAKWKSEYEQISYCFSLADLHEGYIAKAGDYIEETANEAIVSLLKPYFNLESDKLLKIKGYNYKRKNGRIIQKHSQFKFNKFFKCKNGTLISFRKNNSYIEGENKPLFFMFVDINGEEKPNRIGEDIFFIGIFEHSIKAVGYDKDYMRLKQNCSAIGSGLYCSEFYLLGGRF